MKTSRAEDVRDMYDESADGYTELMDSEIGLPIYVDTLGRLSDRIAGLRGMLVDTSCGPGHLLAMYRERFDGDRPLLGIDLSPRMVDIASTRLGPSVEVIPGDMRNLTPVESGAAAGVLSFFAIHHIDPEEVRAALAEWHRILCSGGQLLVAAWEGAGAIDYGEATDLVALRYRSDELDSWARAAGFGVTRCVTEPVEGMPMDAVYLETVKE